MYTQKADDSAQKYGFGKYLNAEDLDKKYLKWKPTSQRTFWCQLLLQWLGRKVSTSKKIILMFVWRRPYQVHTCFNHDLPASAPVIEAELVINTCFIYWYNSSEIPCACHMAHLLNLLILSIRPSINGLIVVLRGNLARRGESRRLEIGGYRQ